MSKLLRLPLTLLAVFAALLFLPGVASGEGQPTAEQCAAEPMLNGCSAPPVGEVVNETPPGGEIVGPPAGPEQQPVEQTEVTPPETEDSAPAGDLVPSGGGTAPGPAARVIEQGPRTQLDAPVIGAILCDADDTTALPPCPESPGTPGEPLSCDELADLLDLPTCPSSFSCEDLADLLGITCPDGPPTCQTLADLFHLGGCPEPPTSCQEFADLLGIDNCSQIPCLDTSQLPAQARDGLAPLLDGLKNIGIKECPAKPATGGNTPPPGRGTYMPNPPAAAAPPPVYYANCDDARAHGATNIPRGSAGYRPELDRDNDGFACDEQTQLAVTPMAAQPTGKLAYTGVDLESQLTVAWTLLMAGSALALVARRRA